MRNLPDLFDRTRSKTRWQGGLSMFEPTYKEHPWPAFRTSISLNFCEMRIRNSILWDHPSSVLNFSSSHSIQIVSWNSASDRRSTSVCSPHSAEQSYKFGQIILAKEWIRDSRDKKVLSGKCVRTRGFSGNFFQIRSMCLLLAIQVVFIGGSRRRDFFIDPTMTILQHMFLEEHSTFPRTRSRITGISHRHENSDEKILSGHKQHLTQKQISKISLLLTLLLRIFAFHLCLFV